MKEKDTIGYAESVGIARVNIEFAHQSIIPLVLSGTTPCLHGEAGLGKTELCKQLAEAFNARYIYCPVPQMSALDYGIPYRDPTDSEYFKMVLPPWSKDIFEAEKEGRPSLICMDEITRYQDKESGSAIFSLISERQLHGRKLPENCYIIATCNPAGGDYQVNEIMTDRAWRRRLAHMELVTSPGAWLKYARAEEFHPYVIDYVEAHLDLLMDIPARAAGKVYANPAGWEKTSEFLKKNGGKILVTPLAGIIGFDIAGDFLSYTQDIEFKLSPATVVLDWKTAEGVLERILEEKRGDIVARLTSSIALWLFSNKPDPKVVAKNLMPFWSRISSEAKVKLGMEIINQEDAGDYYKLLTSAFRETSLWKTKIFPEIKAIWEGN